MFCVVSAIHIKLAQYKIISVVITFIETNSQHDDDC